MSEEKTEVYESPFGDVLCGRCGAELECDECGDDWLWPMPDICPVCGARLDYGCVRTEDTK